MNKLCKVKVATFVVDSGIDHSINSFIRRKNEDGDNFKIIDIKYNAVQCGNYGHTQFAMVIYEDYDMDDYNPEGEKDDV